MDARAAESPVISRRESWLQRERASGRFYDRLAIVSAAALVAMVALAVWLLSRGAEPGTLLSPPLIALLLVAILTGIVQAIFLGVLTGIVSVSGNEVARAAANALGQLISSAVTTPFTAAVLTVMYFDLRVRKEGFDLELLARRLGVEPGTAST